VLHIHVNAWQTVQFLLDWGVGGLVCVCVCVRVYIFSSLSLSLSLLAAASVLLAGVTRIKTATPDTEGGIKKSDPLNKSRCPLLIPLSPVSFFKSESHEWHSSAIQRNPNLQSSILQSAPTGRSRGLRHKRDSADECKAHSQGQINSSLQYRPGWPCNLIWRPSRVTQRPHIRPLHFLCWVSFRGPQGVRTVSLCDGVYVCNAHKGE